MLPTKGQIHNCTNLEYVGEWQDPLLSLSFLYYAYFDGLMTREEQRGLCQTRGLGRQTGVH